MAQEVGVTDSLPMGATGGVTGLRAAIIGTGFIAGVHAQAIRVAGGQVTVVLGSRTTSTASGVDAMRATSRN